MGAMKDLNLKAGVITGDDVLKVFLSISPIADVEQLFEYAREHEFAIPAIVFHVLDVN